MKKNLLLFLVLSFCLLFLQSCESRQNERVNYNTVEYAVRDHIPDSLLAKRDLWITETIKAASNRMTGGDYEDPEDLIEEVGELADKNFQRKSEGLYYTYKTSSDDFGTYVFVPYSKLTPAQKITFNKIKPIALIK